MIAQTSTLLEDHPDPGDDHRGGRADGRRHRRRRFTDADRPSSPPSSAPSATSSRTIVDPAQPGRPRRCTTSASPARRWSRCTPTEDRDVAAPGRGAAGDRPGAWRTTVNDAIATIRDVLSRLTDSAVSRVRGPDGCGSSCGCCSPPASGSSPSSRRSGSPSTARRLRRAARRLRAAALELADERLPGVVERLGRGEDVDVAARRRRWSSATDEIGQVGQRVQRGAGDRHPGRRRAGRRCAAASATCSSTWPGAARRCCTGSSRCSTRWSAGARHRTSWRTCSGSTTWPPGCAATRRT